MEPNHEGVFGPETVRLLRRAFDIAHGKIAQSEAVSTIDRSAVAQAVIEEGRSGDHNIRHLVKAAIQNYSERAQTAASPK